MSNKNNQTERLIDSFGNIDDDIIDKALNYKKKIIPWKKYISVAACVAVVVASVGTWINYSNKKDSVSGVMKDGVSNNDGLKVENASGDVSNGELKGESNRDEQAGSISGDLEDGNNMFTPLPPVDDNHKEHESKDDIIEEQPDESKGDIVEEPDGNSNILPPLKHEVKIDNLNKLAYYSGWTMLKKYGYYNSRLLFAEGNDGIKLLSDIKNYENGYGFDVSETDTPQDSKDVEWEISDEYSGLIPIDPGFGGDVIAYGIYELTVTSVEYFKIEIYNQCFLTEQIGAGQVEVMLLGVKFNNGTTDNMIVFKNGEKYFSCLEESFDEKENGDKAYKFTASKYVSNFSIVKMPELSDYSFSVFFSYDEKGLLAISFEYIEKAENVSNQAVLMDSYDFANNISVSNSAFGLSEELYKIYLENVAAGTVEPILPEKPKLPENSKEPDQSEDIGTLDYLPFAVADLFLLEGEGHFDTDTGFSVISKDSKNTLLIQKLFPNEQFFDLLQKLDEEQKWAVIWVKGRARISDYKARLQQKDEISLSFEYVVFEESDIYTLFAFELLEDYALTSVDFNPVSYSTTVRATFTTDNEYDYIDENTSEDEYIINLHDNVTYALYKNDILIYTGEYKVSYGYVVLCTENDVFYNEISPVSTFVYEIDGRKRIFKLL